MDSPRSETLRRFVDWIAPEGRLESLAAQATLLERAEAAPWEPAAAAELASGAIDRLQRGEQLSDEQADVLEAIILPGERPVIDVVGGSYAAPAPPFAHLDRAEFRASIETAIPSVGRIELPQHPSLPYGGTGFVVGDGVVMTNRHVAELFALGIGREELSFRSGQTAEVDFLRERDRTETRGFSIARIAMVHPYWDMALLHVDGLDDVDPLTLTVAPPDELQGRDVAVIGYPALDQRDNVDLQNRIFGGIFNVKRLQPGKLRERRAIRSFDHDVGAVTHDSSTLGGNSGSAVLDVTTGTVVALHFAGRYLEANYAVPTHALALDGRVVDAGVSFDGEIARPGTLPSDAFWHDADPHWAPVTRAAGESGSAGAASSVAADQVLSWSIPLEVTLQIRSRGSKLASTGPMADGISAPDAGIERLAEPIRDIDFADRCGYDAEFLGLRVPLPDVRDPQLVSHLDDGSHFIPYEHFSIVVAKARRLALLTASNVDADERRKRPEPGRDYTRRGLTGLGPNDVEKWYTDPRIPAAHQLPDRFFTQDRAAFDKGHIVRRDDVTWGDTFAELRRANGDTFHVTNCSPQVADFNRSNLKGVWGELENLILDQAKTERYSVFAGPVLRSDDRFFRGVDDDGSIRVAIPRQFWKIVVARSTDSLQTFAFLLDQDLSDTDLELAVDKVWRSRMISVPALEHLVGEIAFPRELHESDRFQAPEGETIRVRAGLDTLDH